MYTLPGGQVDEGELPETAAMRELSEETGHRALKMIKLRYAYSHPAISTRKTYTFLAYNLILEDPNHQADEFIEVLKLPLKKLYDLYIRTLSLI